MQGFIFFLFYYTNNMEEIHKKLKFETRSTCLREAASA